VNAVLITNGSPPKKLAIEMAPVATPNGDFVCYTKRERFVFRPNHLDILERHFQEDNYPSQEKRDLISQQCNNASIANGELSTSVVHFHGHPSSSMMTSVIMS
jgi:hypothetical protein